MCDAQMVRQARNSENIHSVPQFEPRPMHAVTESETSDHGYDDNNIVIDPRRLEDTMVLWSYATYI